MTDRCMTAADWTLVAPYFTPSEFKVPEKMSYEFMMWLLEVRLRAGVTMNISSSVRSTAYNKQVGGAKDSAHVDVPCRAVDIRPPTKRDAMDPNWNYARFKIVKAAMDCGGVRIGIYQNGSLHLDRTESTRPAPRLWVAV